MSRVVNIQAQLVWHYNQDHKEGGWVATCDALKLVAEGDTHSDLSESIHDLLNTLFHGLWREGRLDAFLREHGWRHEALPDPDGDVYFDVPVHLLPKKVARHGEARAFH